MHKILLGLAVIQIGLSIFLIKKTKQIMNKQERLEQAIGRIDTATNEIASDMKALRDEISAGTVSDESLGRLETNIAKLETLGADPENPAPEEPETPGEEVPPVEEPVPTEGEAGGPVSTDEA